MSMHSKSIFIMWAVVILGLVCLKDQKMAFFSLFWLNSPNDICICTPNEIVGGGFFYFLFLRRSWKVSIWIWDNSLAKKEKKIKEYGIIDYDRTFKGMML